jgi:carbon-monoxide dehydrogenase small subunit
MKQIMTFNINGDTYELAVNPGETLVNVLREQLGLTGTKKGCDDGDCGACSVLVDGKVVASCTTLACEVQNKEIITIEGIYSLNGGLHPVQQAFIDSFAIECGFCSPGMILTTIALLNENPNPTEYEIRDYMRGNLCRCTGYKKIVEAVFAAQKLMAAAK